LVKLADFGLSRDVHQLRTICGSDFYLAPEIWEASPSYTSKIDVWAMGVVILELLGLLQGAISFGFMWCQKIAKIAAILHETRDHRIMAWLLCDMLVVDHRQRLSSGRSLERATLLGFHRWAFSVNESESGSETGGRGSSPPTVVISPRLLQIGSEDGGEAGTRALKFDRPAKFYEGQLEMHLGITTLLEQLQAKRSSTQNQHRKTSQPVDKICGRLKVLNRNNFSTYEYVKEVKITIGPSGDERMWANFSRSDSQEKTPYRVGRAAPRNVGVSCDCKGRI